jgi:hypothetical protein
MLNRITQVLMAALVALAFSACADTEDCSDGAEKIRLPSGEEVCGTPANGQACPAGQVETSGYCHDPVAGSGAGGNGNIAGSGGSGGTGGSGNVIGNQGGAGGGVAGAGGGTAGTGGGAAGAGGSPQGGAGGGANPPGDSVAACQAFLTCARACQDAACQMQCQQANPEGLATYNAIFACGDVNMCADPLQMGQYDTDCLYGNCAMELEGCGFTVPSGMGDCGDLLQCFNRCPDGPGGEACQEDCIRNTSPDGFSNYNAVIECAQTNMCFEEGMDVQACVEGQCGMEWVACVGEPTMPMGNATCGETFACVTMAQTQEAATECFEAADQEGFDLVNTFIGCLSDNMCIGEQGIDAACQQANCAEEAAACEADAAG